MIEGFSRIDQELCTGCGNCKTSCPSDAISGERHKPHKISEERCVGCGRCVQVCNAYDTVFEEHATGRSRRLEIRDLPPGMAEPLFAAHDHCCIPAVKKALADPKCVVVAQCGPAVFGALAEDFGLATESVTPDKIVAALKKIGFRKVYGFSLQAALAVVETAHEVVHRLQTGGILPVITSSCPAAVKYIEQFRPELIHYLAGCKSPHMIAGALMKSYVSGMMHLEPAQIFSVSIGPCTSRKFEAGRAELSAAGYPHVDAVLTTRELGYMIKDAQIDLSTLAEQAFDSELPAVDGMEKVFCSAGDISQAVLHTSHSLIGRDRSPLNLKFAEAGKEGVRTASVQLGEFQVTAVAIAGLADAAPFLDEIKAGKNKVELMELLACPMGCVSGGGQPKVLLPQDRAAVYADRASAYEDAKALENLVHNPAVQSIYRECFGKAPGDKSNRVLNTQYEARKLGQ